MFPDEHTRLSHKVKYTRKKINDGTLEEWKRVMFEEIAEMRGLTIHTGGRTSTGSGIGTGSGTDSGNTSRQYSLNISSADTSKGTVDTSVNKSYSEGSRVNISATPVSGYVFEKWSDGNTSASRTVVMNSDTTLVASFKKQTQGGTDPGEEDNDRPDYI